MLEEGVWLNRASSSNKNLGLKHDKCMSVCSSLEIYFSESVLCFFDFFIALNKNRNASQLVV